MVTSLKVGRLLLLNSSKVKIIQVLLSYLQPVLFFLILNSANTVKIATKPIVCIKETKSNSVEYQWFQITNTKISFLHFVSFKCPLWGLCKAINKVKSSSKSWNQTISSTYTTSNQNPELCVKLGYVVFVI